MIKKLITNISISFIFLIITGCSNNKIEDKQTIYLKDLKTLKDQMNQISNEQFENFIKDNIL